jgi:hypothetical protein
MMVSNACHNPGMGTPVVALEAPSAVRLLDVIERALHLSRSEWLFFRELRVGTGRRNGNLQRLDGFALNSLPHTGMKRICYEVKVSRGDFLAELKSPLKRRIGMRYSNEFYFVAPAGLVLPEEIPPECGLVEAGHATPDQWRGLAPRQAGFFYYDAATCEYCMITAPAPWRDTPGPTWQLTAAMLRHQWRELKEKPPLPAAQQRLELT